MPDAFTFGSLFKALQALHHRRVKTPPQRVPSARACRAHAGTRRRRALMLMTDYRAASVALRACGEYGLAPDAKAFHTVMGMLMAHMHVELVREHVPGAPDAQAALLLRPNAAGRAPKPTFAVPHAIARFEPCEPLGASTRSRGAGDGARAVVRGLQRKPTRVERKHAERVRRLRESEWLAALAEGDLGLD